MRLFFYLLSPFNLRLGYVFCDFITLVVLALNTEIVKISKININIAYSSKNKEYRESLVKRSRLNKALDLIMRHYFAYQEAKRN